MLPSLQTLPPALCFAVPACAGALLLRLCLLGHHRTFLLLSWSALLSLSTLASIAGVLGLNATTGLFSLSQAQLVVENILYTELGVSALYLMSKYSSPAPWLPCSKHIKTYTLLLSSFLFCATVVGLAAPLVPAIPAIIPPLVFLLFTLSTFPLLAHLIHAHLFPPPSAKKPSKLSKPRKKPMRPSVTNPNPTSLPRLTIPTNSNTAITVLIPPPLPSPASSSASFSDQTHKPYSDSKDHYSVVDEIGAIAGSSCSAPILPGHRKSAKSHDDMHADLEANHPLPTLVLTTPEAPPVGIRKRAARLRTRSRSILITLLISQSFALLSGALLLVLGVSDDIITHTTALLRIVETLFIVLCVCGFIFAFYLHGLPLEHGPSAVQAPPTPAPRAIAATQTQDQGGIVPDTKHPAGGEEAEVKVDMMPPFSDGGDCPQNSNAVTPAVGGNPRRGYGLGIDKVPFRIFSSTKSHFRPQELCHGQHQRFASASSSFSSPRPKRSPIAVFDFSHGDEKNQEIDDEGIELPVLTRSGHSAQLPSPPDTPRVRGTEPFWPGHHHYPYQQREEIYFDQEEVKVGIMRPEMKVNVVREFEEAGRYLEVETDVVDAAVSEPGCTNSSVGGDTASVPIELGSSRVWFSECTALPTMTKSPPLSFVTSPKSPSTRSLTLSPRSPAFSIFRSPTSPTTPTSRSASTSAWRRAEKIKARLRGPLTVHHHHSRSSSNVPLEERMDGSGPPGGSGGNGHRRTGSSKIGEWYPFTSKAKLGKGDKQREDGRYKEEGDGEGEEMEMADFVDLTDPFASPTPGFALPKWINTTAGNSSDVDHHGVGHTTMSRGYEVGGAKGKGREREVDDVGSEETKEMRAVGSKAVMMMSRTTAWGRVPVVVGSEHGYEREVTVTDFPEILRTGERERGDVNKKNLAKDIPAPKNERMRRPDSPMPIPTTPSTTYSRSMGVDAMNDVLEDTLDTSRNLGINLGGGLRRVGSRVRKMGSRQSLRSEEGPSSFKATSLLPSPTVQSPVPGEENDIFSDGGNVLGRRRVRNGSAIPLGARTRTSLRRKGSPVPIPFRSSPGSANTSRQRKDTETVATATLGRARDIEQRGRDALPKHLAREEEAEVELNMEEMLLAQRLLRRLDSVSCDDDVE